MSMKNLADAIEKAIDWDFVEVFPGEDPDDGTGYDGPRDLAEFIADSLSLNDLLGAAQDLADLLNAP